MVQIGGRRSIFIGAIGDGHFGRAAVSRLRIGLSGKTGRISAPPAAAATTASPATAAATASPAATTLQGAALRAALLELLGSGAVIHTAECTAVAGGTLRRPRGRPLLQALPAPAGPHVSPVRIPKA